MPKLSAIKKNAAKDTETVDVDFGGVVIKVEWTVAALTGDLVQDLVDDESPRNLAACIATIVRKWDLTDDKDKPLPIDVETVLGLPLQLQNKIMEDIQNSARPAPKAEGSFGGS